MIPVLPSEFRAIIVKESDSLCTSLVKLLKLSVLVWKMVKFKYDPNGALTSNYRTMLCAAECPTGDGSTTSPNPPT